MNHTPGPWEWDGDRLITGSGAEVISAAPWEGSWLSYENKDENAKLIAAAPDLLTACEAILEWDGNNNARCFYLVRGAIDKATK